MIWKRKKGAYRLYNGRKQARVRLKKAEDTPFDSWELKVRDDFGHWSEPMVMSEKDTAKQKGEEHIF